MRPAEEAVLVSQVVSPFDPGRMLALAHRRGLTTQHAIAATIGVNKSTLSRWIHGQYEPSPRLLIELAHHLGVDPSELWSVDPDRRDLTYHRVVAGYSAHAFSGRMGINHMLWRRIECGDAELPRQLHATVAEALGIDDSTLCQALRNRPQRPRRPRLRQRH